MKTNNLSKSILLLGGDGESKLGTTSLYIYNPVPSTCTSPTNSISLLETRFSLLDRTALDVGRGGDSFLGLYHINSMDFFMCVEFVFSI